MSMPSKSRRRFLSGGMTFFGSLATQSLWAKPITVNARRAAIIIGLDRAEGLPQLRAGVSGARNMRDFLEGEGFEVTFFTDTQSEVRAYQIADEVERYVRSPSKPDQLVIYFSGHGTLQGMVEFWLLSRASRNAGEAISVRESAELARLSGIPNVVFISDSCRSVSDSLNLNFLTGQPVFPTDEDSDAHVDVDQFFAARIGRPALELPAVESVAQHEGIFTAAFLKAFREPDADMIHTLNSGVNVIPNRKLHRFLVREVQDRAIEFSLRLNQVPDAMVMSDIPAFMAKSALTPENSKQGRDVEISQASVSNALGEALETVASSPASVASLSGGPIPTTPEAGSLVLNFAARQSEDYILPSTGIVSYGLKILSIDGQDIQSEPVDKRESDFGTVDAWVVRFLNDEPPAGTGVLVTFEDGSSTLVAILREFGAHISLDNDGIFDLRYNPSEESFLFEDFLNEANVGQNGLGNLVLLRGLAAEAKRNGALRFDGTLQERATAADRFAGKIRMGKGLDATLGIYAAYAYAQTFIDEGAVSVHNFMRNDFGISFYDTAMLANAIEYDCESGFSVLPGAPMLRQGWELLRARKQQLSPSINQARSHLKDSLWTTFSRPGTELLRNSIFTDRLLNICKPR